MYAKGKKRRFSWPKLVAVWDGDGSLCPSRCRKKFTKSRKPLSDSEFVEQASIPSELAGRVLAVRGVMAEICHVAPGIIYPQDKPPELIKLMFEWDEIDFLVRLEQNLGVEIKNELPTFTGWRFFWWGENGAASFSDWALRVARVIR
jgi:hypothetical protein